MRQPGNKEVIAVAASETSTRPIDTEGEQDGHERANCTGKCQVQPAGQLKKTERGTMCLANMS